MSEPIEDVLNSLVEVLADEEHDRWSRWQRFLHDRAERQPDGGLLLPPDLVARWERQIITRYADLSEAEKESDRAQVRRYLPLIVAALRDRTP